MPAGVPEGAPAGGFFARETMLSGVSCGDSIWLRIVLYVFVGNRWKTTVQTWGAVLRRVRLEWLFERRLTHAGEWRSVVSG